VQVIQARIMEYGKVKGKNCANLIFLTKTQIAASTRAIRNRFLADKKDFRQLLNDP
jgi:hypothetical protein